MSEVTNSSVRGAESSGFDPDALRRKYDREREKRIRPEGLAQYVEVKGEFAHFREDPYLPRREREPVTEQVEVLILGGGIGGLVAAAHLIRDAGIDNFRMIDRAGDFGGTWYWNRYPGAQCDVESYIYLPLLEETGYIPKEKYSYQPEILEHARRIGRHFDLYPKCLFHTIVKEMRWIEASGRWQVTTDRGDRIDTRYVILSPGPLDKAKLPGIPGIDDFDGHMFHTSRWDYSYTGGDTRGNLGGLADKRVAVIGTGATSIQCIPYLGQHARHLYVFQRTPSVINERGNRATDPEFAKSLTPDWQRQRMENYTCQVLGIETDADLVDDGWTHAARRLFSVYGNADAGDAADPAAARDAEFADYVVMNEVRARVDAIVRDSGTAEALKPWYRFFCKRPLFNDEYLPTFNRSNVTLVDTDGRGIDRITERSIVVGDAEYEVDCIVFATGFEVGTDFSRRVGFDIVGRGGRTLSEHWQDGLRTFHGFYSHGFPNLFHLGTGQNGLTINFHEMAEKQAQHIAAVLRELRDRGKSVIEPTAEAEANWIETIIATGKASLEFQAQCTPSYINNEGQPTEGGKGIIDAQFAAGINEWWSIVSNWRADGRLAGMKVD